MGVYLQRYSLTSSQPRSSWGSKKNLHQPTRATDEPARALPTLRLAILSSGMGFSLSSPSRFAVACFLAAGRSVCRESYLCSNTSSPSPRSFWFSLVLLVSCLFLFDLSFSGKMGQSNLCRHHVKTHLWIQGTRCPLRSWIHRTWSWEKSRFVTTRRQIGR